MSMNKTERRYVEDLETKLALRFTATVKEDLPPPQNGDDYKKLSRGWSYNAYNCTVHKTCSSFLYHGDGWEETRSQQPIWQYSTEMVALRAMRNALENECARKLYEVDKKIKACEQQSVGATS